MASSGDVEKEVPPAARKRATADILDAVGDDGPWQRRIFLVMLFCAIPSATHNLSMAFLAPNQKHWCARPDGSNVTLEQWRRTALPPGGGECFRFRHYNLSADEASTNASREGEELTSCDRWEYDDSFYAATVTSQWDLVCDRDWLVSLSKSIYMVGNLVSVLVFGHLADRLGRRPVITWSGVITVCSAAVCAFSTSFAMFAICRFCIALGISGVFTSGFVLLMEVVGPDLRAVYGVAVEFGWCLGFVCLPAIAWLLRDWFWIQLVITGPCVLLLFIWWFIPESPRWLLSQGRTEDAQKILRKAVKANGRSEAELDAALKNFASKCEESPEKSKGSVLDLLRTPGLWQKTLNLYFIWFVNAFVYYGLTYNTNDLAGDPFVNFAASGAVEFPGYLVSILVIRTLGRRKPLAAAMVVGGAACLLTLPIPTEPWWLSVSVSMAGKFCITCSFAVAFVYTAEIFPTVVRNVGLGTASLCARFGSIIAPFVRELGQATHPSLPMLVFGVLAVLGGLGVLLLPETHRQAVPDTLLEAAERGRPRKKKSPATPKPTQNGHVLDAITDATAPLDDFPPSSPSTPSPPPTLKSTISTMAAAAASTMTSTTSTLPRENGKKLADVPEEDPEVGVEMSTLPLVGEIVAEVEEVVAVGGGEEEVVADSTADLDQVSSAAVVETVQLDESAAEDEVPTQQKTDL